MFRTKSFVAGINSPFLLGALLIAPRAASAQSFNFVTPWNDSSPTEIDISSLNTGPAGNNGHIKVQNGHFVDNTGQRVRFVGVQLIAPDCFPIHDTNNNEAAQFAAHLAKYGINMVRFHFIDEMSHSGNTANGNVWNWNAGHRGELDAAQMDKLDYFFNQLKLHGIYVDFNLKAGRAFQTADTGNAQTDQITGFSPNFRVDYFDRTMIDLQKQFAQKLLTHNNPYTGMAYKDDPAVLSVELNNENALSLDWGGTTGVGLLKLPSSYTGELQSMWNAWLKRKYGNTTALGQAWKVKVGEGADLLGGLDTAAWTHSYNANGPTTYTSAPLALKADVKTTDGIWSASQIYKSNLNLVNGTSYTLRFRVKGSRPSMTFFVANNGTGGNYAGVGPSGLINLTQDWKNYSYTFTAANALANNVSLAFILGDFTGDVSFTNVSLRANGTGTELLPLITDGSGTGWTRAQGSQAVTVYSTEGTAYDANVTATQGDWLSSRLLRSGIPMEIGQNYILRYSAKTDRVSTPVSFYDTNYHEYGARKPTLTSSPEWQDFNIPFTPVSPNTTTGELAFVLGQYMGHLTLADVSLKKQNVTVPNELLNSITNWTTDNSLGASVGMVGSELHVTNTTAGNYDNLAIHQDGRNLQNGHSYTLRFTARSAAPRSILVMVNNPYNNYNVVGIWQNVNVTSTVKNYALTFNAQSITGANQVRVGFAMGDSTGQLWFSNISLQEGAVDVNLPPGESLEANGGLGNISLTDTPTSAQKQDWVNFIGDTEVSYAKEMRDYVKSLAPNTMVTCSQIGFGGLIGMYRERGMDYVDNHSYWDLPGPDGGVTNVAMVHYLDNKGNALAGLAEGRIAGKPYTISEYNEAWPNEYQVECMPLMGSIAGIQDWDMVNFHAYGPYGTRGDQYGYANNKINDNFCIGSNPAKWGFMPSMALMLRKSMVTAASAVDTDHLPASLSNVDFVNMGPTATWTSHSYLESPTDLSSTLLNTRWETSFGTGAGGAGGGTSTVSLTGVNHADKQTGVLTTNADAVKVVVGFVGGQTINVGSCHFGFGSGSPHNFAALTLTAMDSNAINTANKSLLTIGATAQNSGQTWGGVALNHDVNSPTYNQPLVDPVTGENYHLLSSPGDGGAAGVVTPQVHVVMPVDGPREVHALNSVGGFGGYITSTYANNTLTFDVWPGNNTMWFTIVKPAGAPQGLRKPSNHPA